MSQATLHAPTDANAADVYRTVLELLRQAGIPTLVGGTYALEHHADIVRATKDLDLFVRRADWTRVAEALTSHGMDCELTFSHWLGKIRHGEHFVDVVFSGGNGLVEVDDGWLAHGVPAMVLGVPVHLVPAEDMIWSKAFVMERERFDGADVLHILRKSGRTLDWVRLIERFDANAGVLLAHLVLFQFVYPSLFELVPAWVTDELWRRSRDRRGLPQSLCRGTLISREQYLVDVTEWGYEDARALPLGRMTPQQIQEWTAAIERPEDEALEPETLKAIASSPRSRTKARRRLTGRSQGSALS